MRRKIKLTIAYDGTDFYGYQIQSQERTIERELHTAAQRIFKEPFELIGASRTDTGVHALGQVVTLETDTYMDETTVRKAMNAYLPEDVVVQKAEEVPLSFHPRYDAVAKTYIYRIYIARVPLPQLRRFAHFCYKPLDLERMREGAGFLLGEHDFITYSSAGSSAKTTTRTIYSIQIMEKDGLIEVHVRGNGFLYHMVRKIVASLIEVGSGGYQPVRILEMLEARKRSACQIMAPPNGLTLAHIEYSGQVETCPVDEAILDRQQLH